MRQSVKPSIIFYLLFISIFFFSCQRELHFGNSAGSLAHDLNGNCQSITAGGSYIAGKNLTDTNYLQVTVNVTIEGDYFIRTDTVNGYSFRGKGIFSKPGVHTVTLTGSGVPATQGSNVFIVKYDSSICYATINVLPDQNPTGPANFTLQGAPGSCMNDTVSGSYVKSIAIDTGSKVMLGVNVTSPGTYHISSDTVDGYSFSGSGVFSSSGSQTVTLTASGTPLNAGTDVFTVTAANAACTFSVTVLTAVATTNNDHFPLTDSSHWTYDDLIRTGDSLQRKIIDTITINGFLYKIMQEQSASTGSATYKFRKTGSDYFEYGPVDKYTNSFQYATTMNGLIPFLKENLATGDNWQSDEFSGNATFNQIILLRYLFSCVDANATVTVNGKAFTNVYKVTMRPQITSVNNPYGDTGELYTYYYAKGVGIVYAIETRYGFPVFEYKIRNWVVN